MASTVPGSYAEARARLTWVRDEEQMVIDIAPDDSPISIGRSSRSIVLLAGERDSRNHAEIYWEARQWWIRDVASANGTYVNQARVVRPMTLADAAVIRCGDTTITFAQPEPLRGGAASSQPVTVAGPEPPLLTATEREILQVLCGPVLRQSGPPPDNPAIAEMLNISVPAVRQRLRRMYPKFGLPGTDADKRDDLVARAIETGAVFGDGM